MYIAHACAQCTFREFCDTRHRNAAPAWRSMLFFGPYRFWRIILNIQNVNYSYRFYRRFEISRKMSIYSCGFRPRLKIRGLGSAVINCTSFQAIWVERDPGYLALLIFVQFFDLKTV